MSETQNLQTRMMLKGYEQQLLAARRLARFRVRKRLAEGQNPDDPDPDAMRHVFVEKVAKELYESLIFTGTENPVAEEIRNELGEKLGLELEFSYPPGERLQILAHGPEGPRPLDADEQRRSRYALWSLTRQKVDQSMLDKPPARTS